MLIKPSDTRNDITHSIQISSMEKKLPLSAPKTSCSIAQITNSSESERCKRSFSTTNDAAGLATGFRRGLWAATAVVDGGLQVGLGREAGKVPEKEEGD
eukprot:COSAG02_NODE_4152_length_5709_cov_15.912121_1_plen_99_part_00